MKTRRYGPPELADVAERFDAAYTELTKLQRQLVAARRDGVDPEQERELIETALTLLSGLESGIRALGVGMPSQRELDAHALAERIRSVPLDAPLLLAVLGTEGRSHGLPLLAETLERAAAEGALEVFDGRPLTELVSAPRGVGSRIAGRLLKHYGVEPDREPSELAADELHRLCDGLRDAAYGLPDEVAHSRPRDKPPATGAGAGELVLAAWVKAVSPPTETARGAASEASKREGWPKDAIPVAERLLAFTEEELVPRLIPDWERIAAPADEEERIAAIREQRSAWWQGYRVGDRKIGTLIYVLDEYIAANRATRKARRLVDGPEKEWGSTTPFAQARTAGRRCGAVLCACEPDAAAELLRTLP